MKLQIQKLTPEAKIPAISYKGDAGLDLFSIEERTIEAGDKATIRTGLKFAIPEGYAGFIWDKSGLAANHHLKTMAGVIDSNYRGEIQVVLTNLGKQTYQVEKGAKVAQMIVSPVPVLQMAEEQIADETERGVRGFGSSGIQENHMAHTPLPLVPRPSWDEYFMMLAKQAAIMGTCPKRRVGAVIVRNKRVLTTGFNGAPPGLPHCTQEGCLIFEDEGSSCRRALHSEQNAILQDSKNLEGATLYTSFLPCVDCMKEVVAAHIAEVVYEEEYTGSKGRYIHAKEFALGTNVKLRRIPRVDSIEILSRYYAAH